MKKTLLGRLLTTYFSIFVVAVVCLSLVLTFAYREHAFGEKRKVLEKAAYEVGRTLETWSGEAGSSGELGRTLDTLGYMTDSKIYVLRLDREDLAGKGDLGLGAVWDEGHLVEDLNRILEGKTVFRKSRYISGFETHMVLQGVPWRRDGKVFGAVLLFSPVDEIRRDTTRLVLFIWTTAFGVILLGGLFIWLTARRISKPVKEMERASRHLAEGKAVGDIRAETEDEVGRLARTFNTMKSQLLETEAMRKSFIASVSHDLRTPLTSIRGYVDGMLEGVIKAEDHQRYLAVIRHETDRLDRMTSDILQAAQIQSGRLELHKRPLEAAAVINHILEELKASAEVKGIFLKGEAAEGVVVHADWDRLLQILGNIAGNAVKYTGEGGEILVKAFREASGVVFSVRDTGMGIPPEELPLVFEPFYRADKSRGVHGNGSGLGLNIAKSLVELHGGTIRAESVPGEGTEIIFWLPE